MRTLAMACTRTLVPGSTVKGEVSMSSFLTTRLFYHVWSYRVVSPFRDHGRDTKEEKIRPSIIADIPRLANDITN